MLISDNFWGLNPPDHLFHRHGVWRDDLWYSIRHSWQEKGCLTLLFLPIVHNFFLHICCWCSGADSFTGVYERLWNHNLLHEKLKKIHCIFGDFAQKGFRNLYIMNTYIFWDFNKIILKLSFNNSHICLGVFFQLNYFQHCPSALLWMVHSGSDVERVLRDRHLRDHLHIPPRVCRRQQVEHGQLTKVEEKTKEI